MSPSVKESGIICLSSLFSPFSVCLFFFSIHKRQRLVENVVSRFETPVIVPASLDTWCTMTICDRPNVAAAYLIAYEFHCMDDIGQCSGNECGGAWIFLNQTGNPSYSFYLDLCTHLHSEEFGAYVFFLEPVLL